MNIQTKYSALFAILMVLQIICIIHAQRSDKPIKKYISKVNGFVSLVICSNLIITGSHTEVLATIGYYLYYISMTCMIVSLVSFTNAYCKGVNKLSSKEYKPTFMYILGVVDVLQLLLGLIYKHVFTLEQVVIQGKIYYKAIPLIGLTFHRVIDYLLFTCILIIFVISMIRTPKIYREKYTIITITLLLSGAFQAYHIFTKANIDKSVIFHGLFGVLLFYFAIYHRPLRLLDMMLSSIASDMSDAVYMFDSSGKCIWVNDEGYKMLNLPSGKTDSINDAIRNKFGDFKRTEENWSEDVFLPENKEYFIVEKKTVKSDNKNMDGYFYIIKDSTNRRRRVEQELYESTHDRLTGLYNMQLLYMNIGKMLSISDKSAEFYIIYMNVKNFKIINDIFGKAFGNQVLIHIADWLRNNIKESHCVYGRLVGDTFGIMMPASVFSEELFYKDFSKFIVKYKNIQHQLFIHIGVYKITDTDMDISIMFDRAHLSTARIMDSYKTAISYYDDNIRNNIVEEQKLVSQLFDALKEDQIIPYLQPITDKNGKVVGAEALARWIHPEYGFLPPYKFIPVFEKNGLITELDKHIWECVCHILQKWKKEHNNLFISINISPKDFYFTDVVAELNKLIQKYDIDTSKLRIEITETAMFSDVEEKIHIFNKLKESGFIIEIDDFGSGYSSLNMLKDMPVDVLKIDMNFLSKDNNKSKKIVKNVIHLSNDLSITSLTEGVETEQQYKQLAQMGCSLFQGYYFAKPMPVSEFEKFIKT